MEPSEPHDGGKRIWTAAMDCVKAALASKTPRMTAMAILFGLSRDSTWKRSEVGAIIMIVFDHLYEPYPDQLLSFDWPDDEQPSNT